MSARFEIFEDPTGKYRFHFKASDGEIIAASEGFETVASAEKAIEAIRTYAPDAVVETRGRSAPESDNQVSSRTLFTDLSDCPNGNEHRLTVWATHTAADGLTVQGSDSAQWPCDDLTYTYHVAPQHITQLRAVLDGGDNDDLLELLAQRYEDGSMPILSLDSWLKKHRVEYTRSEERHPN